MRAGSKFFFYLTFIIFISHSHLSTEDKITSSPLINLDELKPSFEEIEETNENIDSSTKLRKKKDLLLSGNFSKVKLLGLDKITAKTTNIVVKLGETTKFGPLEIKVLKCGKTNNPSRRVNGDVAYLQVKDLTENENEKVFIFNGWTFSSDPTLAPFDHAIYDLQLINCSNV